MLRLDQVQDLDQSLSEKYDNNETEFLLTTKEMEEVIECVRWTRTQLSQRQINSRTYLKKNSIRMKLLKEHLSPDELRSIDEQARRSAEGRE